MNKLWAYKRRPYLSNLTARQMNNKTHRENHTSDCEHIGSSLISTHTAAFDDDMMMMIWVRYGKIQHSSNK